MGESTCSLGAMLSEYGGRNQPNGEGQAEWNKQEIVEVAEDWNEVRNEVDRAERVGHRESGDCLGRPRNSWIARCQIEGVGVGLEGASPLAPPSESIREVLHRSSQPDR
jgi:hypothetical protein